MGGGRRFCEYCGNLLAARHASTDNLGSLLTCGDASMRIICGLCEGCESAAGEGLYRRGPWPFSP